MEVIIKQFPFFTQIIHTDIENFLSIQEYLMEYSVRYQPIKPDFPLCELKVER